MQLEELTIPRRFCGPSTSGNGGYVCGRVARHFDGPATVRLLSPPPLEAPLSIEARDGVVRLLSAGVPVAEGRAAEIDVTVPEPPSFAQAEQASKGYLGFSRHSFPRCFVCGPRREDGDGMRIFPGPLGGRELVAAPWRVSASLADPAGVVRDEFLWAALDCPGAFAVWPVEAGMATVLGQLTARVDGAVAPGDRCIVAGWLIASDGRKRICGTAVYAESGAVIAAASAVWIVVPARDFPPEP